MIVDLRLCPCGSGLRLARCCQMDFSLIPPAAASGPLLPSIQRAVEQHAQGAVEDAERLCLEVLELAPGQLDGAGAALPHPQGRRAGERGAGSAAADRAAAPQHVVGDPRARPAAVRQGRHCRSRAARPQRGPHRAGEPAIAQSARHDPDRGQPAADRRIPLPQGHRADPGARPDPARQSRLEPAQPGPHGGSRGQLYEEVERGRAQRRADLARLGAAGGGRPQHRTRRASCSTAPSSWRPAIPSIRLSRAVLCGRAGAYSQALAILDAMAPAQDGAGLGANELLEKGRLLDRMGRYEEAFAAFAEGKRLAREATGLGYMEEHAQQLAARLKGFFTESRLAILPRARPRRGHGAADLHSRLSALRHDPGRADAVGAPAHLRRRRIAVRQRDHRGDGAGVEQPARLPRGAGRVVDGRPPRTASTSCATIISSGSASSASSKAARPGSPTRCRSTRPISG